MIKVACKVSIVGCLMCSRSYSYLYVSIPTFEFSTTHSSGWQTISLVIKTLRQFWTQCACVCVCVQAAANTASSISLTCSTTHLHCVPNQTRFTREQSDSNCRVSDADVICTICHSDCLSHFSLFHGMNDGILFNTLTTLTIEHENSADVWWIECSDADHVTGRNVTDDLNGTFRRWSFVWWTNKWRIDWFRSHAWPWMHCIRSSRWTKLFDYRIYFYRIEERNHTHPSLYLQMSLMPLITSFFFS